MPKVRNGERDEQIRQKRKEGLGLKEIADMFGISIQRAGKICGKTGYIKKKEQKPPKDSERRWVVKCGGAEAYLTDITPPGNGNQAVFTYGTKDKKKAKRFKREEAEVIAKQRHAVVHWV